MTFRPISRRTLLKGAGGVAVGLPFLNAMERAHAQTAPAAKRLIIVYTPNGNVPSKFWPSGSETEFTLSTILKPLAPFQDKLQIHRGVDLLSAQAGPGDAHQKGTGTCLTGIEVQEGDFPGDNGLSAGWGDGISIDQQIADQIGTETRFPSLELGVLVSGANVGSRISYRGPARPIPPENNPYISYTRIFGDPDADPVLLERQNAQREIVVDRVRESYATLAARLGQEDRHKLEAHMESIAELQTRLGRASIRFDGACQPLDLSQPIDLELRANMPEIGALQMDLLALALSCDATRVATLMWTNSATKQVFSWLGSDMTEGHHPLAHKGDEDKSAADQLTRINTWYSEQFAYLLGKLDAVSEGEQSLLDNSVVVWVNEQMKGNTHDRNGMPYVMAGGLAGHFKMGRFITHKPGSSSNQLYVSLLNAFDIEAETFGNAKFGSGPLSGLTA